MTLEELRKRIQNTLGLPYAWEKVGLGDLPVDKVASYVRDRSAHLAQDLWSLLDRPEHEYAADGSPERLRAGEIVGADDDGPVRVEYVSRYPQASRERDEWRPRVIRLLNELSQVRDGAPVGAFREAAGRLLDQAAGCPEDYVWPASRRAR